MKNKDIIEWMLDEGIDPLTAVTTEKGEMYLSDVLEKHLTEQLRIHDVVGRSEQLLAFKKWEAEKCKLPWDASPEQIIEQYLSQ